MKVLKALLLVKVNFNLIYGMKSLVLTDMTGKNFAKKLSNSEPVILCYLLQCRLLPLHKSWEITKVSNLTQLIFIHEEY
jgi:hypothetical protein